MGLGSFINKVTGASNSAKQSYKYSSWLQNENFEHQKEAMKNAHQWEVEDLQKAGLNPILSADGTGASAGGVGGGSTVGMQSGMGGLSDIINSAGGLLKLSSEIDNLDKDTELKGAVTGKTNKEVQEVNSRTQLNNAKLKEVASNVLLNSAKTAETKMNTALKKEERARIRKGKVTDLLGTGGFFDLYD